MIFTVINSIFAPLLSLVIVALGNGLFNTLVTVRLHLEGQTSLMIGLVTGAYYGGLVLGSFRCENLISRVGHIRSYAAIASTLAVVSVLQGLILNPWIDFALRFIAGMCMAGVFIIVESWMLARCDKKTRGQILGIYMMAIYAAQASGQFLLNLSDPLTIIPFCIVALLTSLSVLPVSLTLQTMPEIEKPSVLGFIKLYKLSPSGMMTCFISGLVLGAIYGLMPLFIADQDTQVSHVALIMSMIIYGGMALQYPIGKLSDKFNRRKVLMSVALLLTITALVILLYAHRSLNTFMVFGFLFGGFTFTIYPLGVSLACDKVNPKDLIAATQGLLLAYGVGATIGPMIAPLPMRFSHNGLMGYFIVLGAFLTAFLFWRNTVGEPIDVQAQQDFVPLTRTSPVVSELDPRQN